MACSLFSLPSVMGEDVPPPDSQPVEAPVDEEPAPAQDTPTQPDSSSPIPAADSVATIDCNLFDLAQFNAIVGADFTLVTQDQLGSCNYDANSIYRLLIGGGQPATSESSQSIFEMSFGKVPGAEWQAYAEGFQLGTAASSISVTGQGVSANGHAMIIVAIGDPSSDLAALQETLTILVKEAARQLNGQW